MYISRLLYKFVENERNVKDNDNFNVTYFVSGLSKPEGNGEQVSFLKKKLY